MSGLFGILDLSSRALAINQRGVQTAGHNIANANTEGFSRQQQVLAAETPEFHATGSLGTGVKQVTVQRFHNAFVQEQLLLNGSLSGATKEQADALAAIEQVVNEQGADGITAVLNHFYDSLSDLSSATVPGAPVERAAVLGTAQSTIGTLKAMDSQLRATQASMNSGIQTVIPQVNQIAKQISQLNGEIQFQESVAPANDLRDQRDLLTQKLAGLIDIHSFENPKGELVVFVAGGLPLVEGSRARQLVAVPDLTNPFDPRFVNIQFQDGTNQTDITPDIGGGKLGGLLRARDTLLSGAIRSLDSVAYNLVSTVNSVHNAGLGLTGYSGNFFNSLPQVENAARDISIVGAVANNPDNIAAGLTTNPGDNQNALALAALRNAASPIFLPGDPPGPASGPSRTLLDHAVSIVTDVGQQSQTMQQSKLQNDRVMQNLQNRRDEVSGVAIDEEVTNLVRLQAAFQANSRVIGVVDQMLQDVLQLVR